MASPALSLCFHFPPSLTFSYRWRERRERKKKGEREEERRTAPFGFSFLSWRGEGAGSEGGREEKKEGGKVCHRRFYHFSHHLFFPKRAPVRVGGGKGERKK